MALAFAALASTADTSDLTTYTLPTVTFTAGRMYLLTLQPSDAGDPPPTISSVTTAGVTWSLVTMILHDTVGTASRMALYVGACTATGTVATSVVLGSGGLNLLSGIVEVTGSRTTAATMIVQSVTATGTSGTAAATLAALASSNNWAFGFVCSANDGGITETSTWTELLERAVATTLGHEVQVKANATALSSALSGTPQWGVILVEVAAGAEAKSLSGAITPTGALEKFMSKTLSGSITPEGVFDTLVTRVIELAGSITPVGDLAKTVSKTLAGSITPTGSLAVQWLTSFLSPLVGGTLNLIAQVTDALHLTSHAEDTLELDPLEEDER